MHPADAREDEDPGLDGPDYLTLVIEWSERSDPAADDIAAEDVEAFFAARDDTVEASDPAAAARAILPELSPEPARHISTSRTIAAVLGALGALALAVWGVRHLRSA